MLSAFIVNANILPGSGATSKRAPASEETSWKIKTYFEGVNDPKTVTVDGVEQSLESYYGARIHMERTERGYSARYFGPLYAQCTGAKCDPQGYQITLDACGRFTGFTQSGLKRYHPGLKDKSEHSLLLPEVLQRISFYLNQPEVMRAIYEDIAGSDRKSNYVLGNSVQYDQSPEAVKRLSSEASEAQYSQLGSTRWALSPWATNTIATFFIHMDLIRQSIAARVPEKDRRDCPHWPAFPGQTPVPRGPENLAEKHVTDRIWFEANREDVRMQRRLDNFEVESVINREAQSQGTNLVLGYAMSGGGGAELANLRRLKGETAQRLARAEDLKKAYFEAWRDLQLSADEVKRIFEAFCAVQARDLDLTYEKIGNAEGFSAIAPRTYADDPSAEGEIAEARKEMKLRHERLQQEWRELNLPPQR